METLSVLLKPDVFQLEDIKSVKSVSLTSEMTTMSNVSNSQNINTEYWFPQCDKLFPLLLVKLSKIPKQRLRIFIGHTMSL